MRTSLFSDYRKKRCSPPPPVLALRVFGACPSASSAIDSNPIAGVHVEDEQAARPAGRDPHVGLGPSPPPRPYLALVGSGVPEPVIRERPLAGRLAWEDGHPTRRVGERATEHGALSFSLWTFRGHCHMAAMLTD